MLITARNIVLELHVSNTPYLMACYKYKYSYFRFCDLNKKSKKLKEQRFFSQHISDQNLLSSRNEIADIDWTPVTLQANIDDYYDTFLSIKRNVYHRRLFYKTITSSKIRKPWITPLHLKRSCIKIVCTEVSLLQGTLIN